LEKNAFFKGHLAETELAQLFAAASALVFPSLHEGFGIPPLEAMKLGVPVLTSETGSLREVVGDAGLLVDPRKPVELAKAMLELASSKELQLELKRRGKERVQSFSFSAEVSKLAEVFVAEATKARKLTVRERLQRPIALLRLNILRWRRGTAGKLFRVLRDRL
jgi:glycosyltransferase involved in cell wall biosynthesis